MNIIVKCYWILRTQLGIDPKVAFCSLRGLLRYLRSFLQFRADYEGRIELMPCLHDWYEEGGDTKSEYFWQDLHVAQAIYLKNPMKHVDIGSRIDGFVTHVASFREIEVFDIRSVTSQVPGVIFRQQDFMNPSESPIEYCDSLSCLHALEHFGLGRYGDEIDPGGYAVGLKNMVKTLQLGGLFYLSVPIGIERVEFNAHRVFDPCSLIQLAEANNLSLKDFAWIGANQLLIQSVNFEQDMNELSNQRYALGIFTFVKQ